MNLRKYEKDIKKISGKELLLEKGKVESEFEDKSEIIRYEIEIRILNKKINL